MARRRSFRVDGMAIAALCALSVVFYRHIALSNRILSGVDAFTYFYPYRDYAAQMIREGHVPLWNPYLFLGVPFLANPQTAVLYPLNIALAWLSAPKILAWSAVLHTALAAGLSYLYARSSLRLAPAAAFLAASAYGLGGYLSGQVEHINQLNVLAWFPLLLLLWDLRARARWAALLGLGVTVGAGLLAGHAQSSYISLFGLSIYALFPALVDLCRALWKARKSLRTKTYDVWQTSYVSLMQVGALVLQLALVCTIGVGIAAAQLLPTLELAPTSIRGGGLSFREAVAFSLKPLPRLLRYTFLPPWGSSLDAVFGDTSYTEYLAYVGVLPLLLGGGWLLVRLWGMVRGRKSLYEVPWESPVTRLLLVGSLGIALALGLYNPLYPVLYKVVPGFGLFRVPARWLFLYAFAVAMIAGVGAQRLVDWRSSITGRATPLLWAWLLVPIAVLELFAASTALPLSRPTAPEAYASLRTAPAHILAAQQQDVAPGRFLSLSDMLFDPGDLREMQGIYQGQLTEQEIYDLVVCAKRKEILAPNLPLSWRAYAVDGYDGGLLPLARYLQIQRLFLDESDILPDGRLREGLERIPPSRLLSLLGTRYVLTDKVHDVWIDDVFYDLSFDAVLGAEGAAAIASEDVSRFAATGLGVVSYLEGARDVPDGTAVAEIRLTTAGGGTRTYLLRAGLDTAQGLYDTGVAHAQARIGHTWRDQPAGADYVTVLKWDTAVQIARIEVSALPLGEEANDRGQIHVRGLALLDERDGSNVPLLLSTGGRFRQVHSGDVKIYEVLDALPRATLVHRTRIVADDEAAIAAIADLGFNPAREAVLAAGQPLNHDTPEDTAVEIVLYEPERIAIQVSSGAPGYLVLSDAWYPGWQATLDGRAATIERANVHFRAVHVPAGAHTVHLTYRPASFRIGAGLSLLSLAAVAVSAAMIARRTRHKAHCTQPPADV